MPATAGTIAAAIPGTRGVAEKVVTLDTAQRLQKILRSRGLRTVMTREDDNFIPLGQRVAYTSGRGDNAVFVSVHFNGAPREGASGIETYYYRGDSFGLAARMHRSILAATGAEDRWLRRRGFYVIRNSRVPAVLCELGFLTNIDEQNRIANSSSYRQKLAQGMADAIIAQRSSGDPDGLGIQPPVTTERLGGRRVRGRSRRGGRSYYSSSRSGRGGRRAASAATAAVPGVRKAAAPGKGAAVAAAANAAERGAADRRAPLAGCGCPHFMIVTSAEMRAIEEVAFQTGSTPESLMDAVGRQIADRFRRDDAAWDQAPLILFYGGKGNNAGDAFVAARRLEKFARRSGRREARPVICLRLADAGETLGDLPRKKLAELPDRIRRFSSEAEVERMVSRAGRHRVPLIIFDGLLGLGAHGPLREPIRTLAREINALRLRHGARVISLDFPSGLDADTGEPAADAVVADETWTVGFVKTGLVADAATNHVGRLSVLNSAEFDAAAAGASLAAAAAQRGALATPAGLAGLLPPRSFDGHKGLFGHIGILAGSVGATGAAVMCSHAAVRAGAGLVTLFVERDVYPIVAAAAAPEVMVRPLDSPVELLAAEAREKFDVLAVGPGLGRAGDGPIRELIEHWPGPMVVDADGLNALAANDDLGPLDRARGPRLLTPHPGEMARLRRADGKGESKVSRLETARDFTARRPGVTLLLKGARTLTAQHDRAPVYNTTGNPGMGTGGMGDILTGICAALLGQKLSPFDAARLGAWIHGRAADLAFAGDQSEESLVATDLLPHLGAAFREVRPGAAAAAL